jgi:hypothetical protein
LRPSSLVMCNTPVEVQFITSAGCLNYPCRTPVATQFKLEDRILIGKAAALAVHVGERKAQAGRVDPPLAELA